MTDTDRLAALASQTVSPGFRTTSGRSQDANRTTTTVYSENADRLTTTVTVTNPAGHTSTSSFDVTRAVPLTVTDANSKVTTGTYDAVGRLLSVTRPGNTTGTPDVEYAYTLSKTAPSWVRTRALGPNGNQITSYEIYDGLLQHRQTQATSADGKRVITENVYDERGLTAKESTFWNTDSTPTSTLVTAADCVDDHGRVAEKRQYHTSNTAGAFDKTTYGYNLRGYLTPIVDPAGNTWSYTYDLLGRKTQSVDPDAGTALPYRTYLGDNDKRVRLTTQHGTSARRLLDARVHTENPTTPGTWDDKFSTQYAYQDNGLITVIAGKTDGQRDQVECFTYDHQQRLTEAWTEATWNCATPQRAGADPYWRQWTFDTIGSRLTQVDKNPATGDTTWTYTSPNPGQARPHTVTTATGFSATHPTTPPSTSATPNSNSPPAAPKPTAPATTTATPSATPPA